MDKRVKEAIEKYVEYPQTGDFDTLYVKASDDIYFSDKIGQLTDVLLDSDINPLEGLLLVPPTYLYMS